MKRPVVAIEISQSAFLDIFEKVGRFTYIDANGEYWHVVTKSNAYGKIVLTNDDNWVEKHLCAPGNSQSFPS